MDPKVVFWTGALTNMGVVVLLACAGVRALRRGDVPRHRRRMVLAACLVVLFLVSYVFKLAFLGREEMSRWSQSAVWMLRIHETCVLTLLIAGSLAGWRAFRMRATRAVTRDPRDPRAPASTVAWHRRAGWVAVVATVLGFLTAAVVLAGMYQRAGLLPGIGQG